MKYCDFCGAQKPNPVRYYPARDFSYQGIPRSVTLGRSYFGGSIGRWEACVACAELIDGEQWDQLARRSVEQQELRQGRGFPNRGFILTAIKKLHQRFQQNRIK